MMDLINRDDALAIVKYSKDPADGIKNLPVVDAMEVVHGQVLVHEGHEDDYYEYCSVCKSKDVSKEDNFCPNCGAQMDGESNE